MANSIGKRLEQYTAQRAQEVLIVTTQTEGELDKIAIFRGFSSSLVNPTAFDPEIPVLADGAQILNIDRVASPYDPEKPVYIQQGLTWEEMQPLLQAAGV
ncbi:MAG: hypothetical protein ACFB4I_24090 [Cyanophyceae cyanobacterium]